MTDNNTALKKAGLKVTLPRLKILEVLQEPDNHHVSAEDLYKRLIDMGEGDRSGDRLPRPQPV